MGHRLDQIHVFLVYTEASTCIQASMRVEVTSSRESLDRNLVLLAASPVTCEVLLDLPLALLHFLDVLAYIP